jgi:hypothetical protein
MKRITEVISKTVAGNIHLILILGSVFLASCGGGQKTTDQTYEDYKIDKSHYERAWVMENPVRMDSSLITKDSIKFDLKVTVKKEGGGIVDAYIDSYSKARQINKGDELVITRGSIPKVTNRGIDMKKPIRAKIVHVVPDDELTHRLNLVIDPDYARYANCIIVAGPMGEIFEKRLSFHHNDGDDLVQEPGINLVIDPDMDEVLEVVSEDGYFGDIVMQSGVVFDTLVYNPHDLYNTFVSRLEKAKFLKMDQSNKSLRIVFDEGDDNAKRLIQSGQQLDGVVYRGVRGEEKILVSSNQALPKIRIGTVVRNVNNSLRLMDVKDAFGNHYDIPYEKISSRIMPDLVTPGDRVTIRSSVYGDEIIEHSPRS